MPVVLRVGGFSFTIFTDEHEPAHVHVRYAGKKCRIALETLLLTRSNMSRSDAARAVHLVADHREELLLAWIELKLNKGDDE
jgi:hypothetical protein